MHYKIEIYWNPKWLLTTRYKLEKVIIENCPKKRFCTKMRLPGLVLIQCFGTFFLNDCCFQMFWKLSLSML
jgi:hypothetical protein